MRGRSINTTEEPKSSKYDCSQSGHRFVFSHYCDVYQNVGFCVECEKYTMDSLEGCYDMDHIRPIDTVLSNHFVRDFESLKLENQRSDTFMI